MSIRPATIAIYSENAAFSELLRAVLADQIGVRVSVYAHLHELSLYAGGGEIDLIIADTELGSEDATDCGQTILASKSESETPVQSICLTRQINGWSRIRAVGAGFDEVLIKPMSPLLLAERVQARLAKAVELRRHDDNGPDMSNVVALSDWRARKQGAPTELRPN